MANKKQNTEKKAKSKSQQRKEVGAFALGAAAVGFAAAKAAKKGKNKKQKKVINAVAFILVVVIIVCGVMFYMDIAPFNFEINGDSFKFYSYTPIIPVKDIGDLQLSDFRLHVIDVNQGDCLFLQLPDGKNMLIDGAKKSDVIANGILDYLFADANGIAADGKVVIDYVVLTHADADHCGSLDDVIKSDKVDVKNVYRPLILSSYESDSLKEYASANNLGYSTITTVVYKEFVKAVEEENGCQTYYNLGNRTLSGDGYTMYFFNPTIDMYQDIKSAQDKNNVSPIIILDLEVAGKKIALTGDADKEQEDNFISQLSDNEYGIDSAFCDVDILKVAHHGGKESSNQEFLEVVKPEYALISVGAKNTYGHPTQEALQRLDGIGCKTIYRTDLNGSIVVTVTADGTLSFDTTGSVSAAAGAGRFGYDFFAVYKNLIKSAKQYMAA